jgi:hypothetical protein
VPTEIACSLYFSQRQRKEELSPVKKTAIIGLLALVSAALAAWAMRFQGAQVALIRESFKLS